MYNEAVELVVKEIMLQANEYWLRMLLCRKLVSEPYWSGSY